MVAFITKSNNTFDGWSKIFEIICGMSIIDCIIYLIFTTSEPQLWNLEENEESEVEQPLREI